MSRQDTYLVMGHKHRRKHDLVDIHVGHVLNSASSFSDHLGVILVRLCNCFGGILQSTKDNERLGRYSYLENRPYSRTGQTAGNESKILAPNIWDVARFVCPVLHPKAQCDGLNRCAQSSGNCNTLVILVPRKRHLPPTPWLTSSEGILVFEYGVEAFSRCKPKTAPVCSAASVAAGLFRVTLSSFSSRASRGSLYTKTNVP